MPNSTIRTGCVDFILSRFGELTSEEAKGKAWDRKRLFNTGRFGTTENLLRFMAGTLRQAAPKLDRQLSTFDFDVELIRHLTGTLGAHPS